MHDEQLHLALHEASCTFYTDPSADCSQLMYAHAHNPIAQETILYGMEWRNWMPPANIVQLLWRNAGKHNPNAFFCAGVFKHKTLWAHIVHQLAFERKWQLLCCNAAIQAAAWSGHITCSYMYANALIHTDDEQDFTHILRLGATFVPPDMLDALHVKTIVRLAQQDTYHVSAMIWLNLLDGTNLALAANELVRWNAPNHLLERIARDCPTRFQDAVRNFPQCKASAADLARPLADLTDQALAHMANTYAATPLAKLEWHTEALSRGIIAIQAFGPPPPPDDIHKLLYWNRCYGFYAPASCYLVGKALRDAPDACNALIHLGAYSLQAILDEHRAQRRALLKLVGTWPLPDDIVDTLVLYL